MHPATIAPRTIALFATALAAAASLHAQSGTWITNDNGLWTDSLNWLDGTIATGTANTASFTTELTDTDKTVSLNGARTIGNIVFTDGTASSNNLTLSGSTLTLAGTFMGPAPSISVTQSDRTLAIDSVITGADGLTKTGPGTLSLRAANTYTGVTTINGGTLRLEGASGAIGSSGSIVLNNRSTLTLANASAANHTARIADSAAITSNGGTLNFTHDGSDTAFAETVGALTLNRGALIVNTSQAGAAGSSALTFASISRAAGGGTALFSGTGFGVDTRNQVLVTSDLGTANVGGILPWALIKDGGTYDLAVGGGAGGAITKLTTYTTAGGTATAWNAATINARPGLDVTLNGTRTLNSLVLDNGIDFNAPTSNRVITIGAATQAGLIVQTGGTSILNVSAETSGGFGYTFAFGTQEGIIHTVGDLTILRGGQNIFTGSGGITKTGPGTLTIGSVARLAGHTNSGALSMNEGVFHVIANGTGALEPFSSINFNGGHLTWTDGNARTLTKLVNVNADATITLNRGSAGGSGGVVTFGATTINNNATLTFTGALNWNDDATVNPALATLALNTSATLNVVNPSTGTGKATSLTVGAISESGGARSLTKAGNGLLFLSAANAYTGGTTVSEGTLFVTNTTGSGTGAGAVNVTGTATLGGNGIISGATTIADTAFLAPGRRFSAERGNLTFGDDLALNGTLVWKINANDTATGFDSVTLTGGDMILGTSSVFQISPFAGVDFTNAFWSTAQAWTVVNNTGSGFILGSFAGGLTGLSSNEFGSFSLAYGAGAGGDVTLHWSAIPEPSAFAALAGLGALGFVAARRRRTA